MSVPVSPSIELVRRSTNLPCLPQQLALANPCCCLNRCSRHPLLFPSAYCIPLAGRASLAWLDGTWNSGRGVAVEQLASKSIKEVLSEPEGQRLAQVTNACSYRVNKCPKMQWYDSGGHDSQGRRVWYCTCNCMLKEGRQTDTYCINPSAIVGASIECSPLVKTSIERSFRSADIPVLSCCPSLHTPETKGYPKWDTNYPIIHFMVGNRCFVMARLDPTQINPPARIELRPNSSGFVMLPTFSSRRTSCTWMRKCPCCRRRLSSRTAASSSCRSSCLGVRQFWRSSRTSRY